MIWLLQLVVVAYLPGAVVFRLPIAARGRRAGLSAEERAFWAVVISVAWSCAVALLLAALERYRFERLLAVDVASAACLALAFRGHLLYRGEAARVSLAALIPVAFLLAGLWLYFPTAEWIVGGKDPGVYLNEGIQIAQRGSLVVHDEVVASTPARFWDLFFPSYHSREYYSLRFMGFFLTDPRTGSVVGQFPHLFPASIAIGYGLRGLAGGLDAAGAWAILGLLGTYFLGTRLFGRAAAVTATVLLAINVTQVWFAHNPNSEMVTQAFTTAALLAAARSLVDGDRFFAPIAGALLGLMLFARFDAALVIAGVVAAVALAPLVQRRMGFLFWATLLPLVGLAVYYFATLLKPYGTYPLGFVRHEGGPLVALAVVVVAMAIRVAARFDRLRVALVRIIPVIGALGIAALATYAYFFRQSIGRIAPHDAAAFRTFAWYVTAPGLLLAVAGAVVFVWRRFWRDPAFVVTLGASALFFFYKARIIPEHFWLARRFLSLILPAALLLMAGLFSRALWESPDAPSTRPRTRRVVRVLLGGATVATALVFGFLFWQQTRPILRHVEYAGLVPRLEQLAGRFGDRDLVIIESRAASDMHVFALPLGYIYAKHVLVLPSPRPDKALFAAFLSWARQHYANVYFLGGGGSDLLSRQIAVTSVASERFQVPEWDSPRNSYPTGPRMREFDYGLYRFVDPTAATGRLDLSVGVQDDLNMIRFHAKERLLATGQPFRWTRDSSYVALPGLTALTRSVTLWLSDGGRPASLGPCTVRVSLDDQPLGEVVVQRAVRPFSFPIQEALARRAAASDEPARLAIRTTTWTPRAALNVPDDRKLGVMLTKVEVR